jgi:hypothetical protein
MPSLEKAERREKKLEKRKTRMPKHGMKSIEVIQQEIVRRAAKRDRLQERLGIENES